MSATARPVTAHLGTSHPDQHSEQHPRQPVAAGCECCSPAAWGQPWELGTAAFWVQQAAEFAPGRGRHQLGRTLREEVAVCMLGGYGVPAAVGNAAFRVLRDAGLFADPLDEEVAAARMIDILAQPLTVGPDRAARYRFHQQRPRRLAAALTQLSKWENRVDDLSDVALRDSLMQLTGIGPKTASWIVRNHRDSDAVAIIDIHIHRAGLTAGAFCANWTLQRDYHRYEDAFLDWARSGFVSAADLDAAIWRLLAALGRHGRTFMERLDRTPSTAEPVSETLFNL